MIVIKIAKNQKEINLAKSIREQVFQKEQGVKKEIDFDGKDFVK